MIVTVNCRSDTVTALSTLADFYRQVTPEVRYALSQVTHQPGTVATVIIETSENDGKRDGKATKMQSLKIVQRQLNAFITPALLTIEWE